MNQLSLQNVTMDYLNNGDEQDYSLVPRINNKEIKQKKNLNLKLYFLTLVISLFTHIFPAISQKITTPEVYSFKQEALSAVSFYTGQANISIPLYHIETNEITIPISLNYIGGEGFHAINPYSSIGLGWKISAGGAITRTINEVPDEQIAYGSKLGGFFNYTPVAPITNDYVRNSASSLLVSDGSGHVYFNSNYEYAPDIFSFSFLGYSGYFVMGYDGKFKVSSKDIVSVTKSTPPGFDYNLGPTVQFIVTANDGTIFTFGSTPGSIVFSGGENAVPYQMDAWYLTRIQATNGKIIDFTYLPNTIQSDRIHFKSSVNQQSYSVTSFAILDKITYNNGNVIFTSTGKSQDLDGFGGLLKSIDKIVVQNVNSQVTRQVNLNYFSQQGRYQFLSSLNVDDKQYSFGYSNLGNLPSSGGISYGSDYWGFYNGQYEVTGGVKPGYRDIYLNQYITLTGKLPNEYNTKVGVLASITHPTGVTEYFTYEQNTCSHRGISTLGGYYQQQMANPVAVGGLRIAMITMGDQVKKYRYVQTFDPNYPDAISTSSGILYKVPAVDYMNGQILNTLSIEGEPPVTYSKVIEYLSDKSYTVYTMNSELDHPDVQNNMSSNYYAAWASNSAIFNYIMQSSFVGSLGKNSSCAIERGQVNKIEVYDSSNKLKKSTSFIYSQDPNRYSQYVSGIFMANTATNSVASLAYELGYQYLNITNLYFSILHSYCIYTFPVYLTQEVVTDYSEDNKSVTSTTKYEYNLQKLKSSVLTYDSKGDSVKTKFKYPYDFPSTTITNTCEINRQTCLAAAVTKRDQMLAQCNQIPDPGARATCISAYTSTYNYDVAQCQSVFAGCISIPASDQQIITEMQNKNMINVVIEEQKSQFKNNTTALTGGTINKFTKQNGLIVAGGKYSLELNNPSSDLTASSINASGALIFHPNYIKKLTYDKYDTNGNILQYHLSDNTNTSFIWSYNGSMPVMKGDNVTYDILNAAVIAAGATYMETFWNGFNNIVTDAAQQTTWKNFNTALRSNASLANAQVTTYTYSPLVGMTSSTDPNGIITYFEYDSFGRLKNVKDKDQNILKSNQYHYYNN